MAVSQGWSGWAAGWFEGEGKILEIIATGRRHFLTHRTEASNKVSVEHP
jgi:hypothetical protein